MKKRILIIYLVGVFLALGLGLNNWTRHVKRIERPMTYGDLAFVGSISLYSWVAVVAWGVIELSEMKFWSRPI